MAADVKIDIAAEFTGKKAFKQADTATQKLTGNVKKLAGAVGLAYGTSAIIAYGKASVKAFAQDEAAAIRLNRAVENLGIGFANPEIADYIAKLEKSAAIADDILRPAFQGLLTTTGSLTQSQKLLNDAITISRASGIDLGTVTNDLAKGYVGVTKGLTKYNSGLSKAELASMSFNQILGVLLKRSAGSAEDYLGSTAYQMDVLGIATGNASEIIGGGLVDAFAAIGGGTEASDAAYVIESIATALAKVTAASGRTIGVIPTLIKNLKNLPSQIFAGFAGKQIGINLPTTVKQEENKLTLTQVQQQKALAKLEAAALKRNQELVKAKSKQVLADKSKVAIAKAELALGKGTDVFDMEKIQLLAAEKSAVEQIGKATSQAQLLGITGDLARLRVKQDIIALEDAIASKDEQSIIAATNKLNADLKILGALTGQDLKLKDIKSILEDIVPKDLINLTNLDEAIAKLKLIAAGFGTSTSVSTSNTGAITPKLLTPAEINKKLAEGSFVPQVAASGGSLGGSSSAGAYASSGFPGAEKNNGTVNITVNTGIGDPNAIAEAITEVVREAVDRGTLRAS
jgi:hypothetical protein